MHDNIPARSDPEWEFSRTIWIPRKPRMPKLNKSERTKRTKMILPVVVKAHPNASRFHRRLHIAESGTRQTGTRKDSTTFLASSGTKVGMPLNPTGILLCGLQGGEHVPGEFATLLRNGEWCGECRRSLELWLIRQEIS